MNDCIFLTLTEGARCTRCNYPLNRNYTGERFIRNCKGPPTHRDRTKSQDCRHRGEYLRLEECTTCQGRKRIKVFECEIHTECTLAKAVGVAVCGRCDDYESEDNHD